MKFIADLHIHSHFSMATSRNLTPEHLDLWARIKGIDVVGTGDCVHPGWLNELENKLTPEANGLYSLKNEFSLETDTLYRNGRQRRPVYFMLSGEISSIYKKNGKVRKVHNVAFFPDFQAARTLQARLRQIGNIESDGRPILGLDSKVLLEMVLETSPTSFLVPAHIWTPWFSVLGSKSGYDSIEECYEDLTGEIFAVETGLSSDPAMNWACSFLDRYRLVSNSDAHSPEKLGREANLFDCELSYRGIYSALKKDDGFIGTYEFFPQEGKYHYDGHRSCEICWDPKTTLEHNGICPVCGKPVTRGVMYRVAELADRPQGQRPAGAKEFFSITPLPEILAEIYGHKSSASRKVQQEYLRLIRTYGSEFWIMAEISLENLRQGGDERLADALWRLRSGHVQVAEGFDGEFGKISIYADGATTNLFSRDSDQNKADIQIQAASGAIHFDIAAFQSRKRELVVPVAVEASDGVEIQKLFLNTGQKKIIYDTESSLYVQAGPGTGKTRVLTEKIKFLVTQGKVDPVRILALTFTNQAAKEMRDRLSAVFQGVYTFHSWGLGFLRAHASLVGLNSSFFIANDRERREIEKETGLSAGQSQAISLFKQTQEGAFPHIEEKFTDYNNALRRRNLVDVDDLIWLPLQLLQAHPELCAQLQKAYSWILVDEVQDINQSQKDLLTKFAGGSARFLCIGDQNQSIYGFRGSRPEILTSLFVSIPALIQISLEQSYRCPASILRFALQVLEAPQGAATPLVGTGNPDRIQIHHFVSDKSEAEWIARQIQSMSGGLRSFSRDSGISSDGALGLEGELALSDFAILCRSSLIFPEIKAALDRHAIPYRLAGEEPLSRQEPYASLIHLLRERWQEQVVPRPPSVFSALVTLYLEGVGQKEEHFISIPEEEVRQNLEWLALPYGDNFVAFLDSVSLRVLSGDDPESTRGVQHVHIMTIHAAKGREFPVVFLPGLEENLLPFQLFTSADREQLAEEARVLYVGMTRTKKYLFASYVDLRFFKGKVWQQKITPFLQRGEKDLVDFIHHTEKIRTSKQLELWQ